MCSPLHFSILSAGRQPPAEPTITDDEHRSDAEMIATGDLDRPGAGSAPAPGRKREIERV
jgi:hypothetical protein